jgi:hypothetical protein
MADAREICARVSSFTPSHFAPKAAMFTWLKALPVQSSVNMRTIGKDRHRQSVHNT